jgi:hypothetical protein
VVAVIWLIVGIALVVLGVVSLIWRSSRPDEGTYQVMVALHLIRRRLDVSQFKLELRRDAANLRREMRAELRRLDEWKDR